MAEVVLVDKRDRKLGLMDKEEAHRRGRLHRAVSVLLYRVSRQRAGRQNSDREKRVEVLLQRRREDHPRWPKFWANTVCTDLREGESRIESGVRRLREEMGIEMKPGDLRLMFKFIYEVRYDGTTGEHELDGVVVGKWDGEPKINKAEVEDYKWAEWQKLKEEVRRGKGGGYAPWFVQMVENPKLDRALNKTGGQSLRGEGVKGEEKERVGRRRKLVEKKTGVVLDDTAVFSIDPEQVKGRNLENMIGVAQVPLGVAGPLRIRFDFAQRRRSGQAQIKNEKLKIKNYFIPLATTEGALVASVNRGCKVVGLSGGVRVRVEQVGATRGPVFRVRGLAEGEKFRNWLDDNKRKLKQTAEKTSGHVRLLDYKFEQVGRSVWIRFRFDTGEAMGMNMATKATQAVVELIEKEIGIKCVSLSGNACADKKPAWVNVVRGRGKKVWAEVVVKEKVIKEVLKTTAEKVVEVVKRKQWLGSAMHGVMGGNGHFANVIAALFLATGQDLGHVGECSVGWVDAEAEKREDLYFAIYLPDLMVGTVGGGTGLPTQKEALGILGLGRGNKGEAIKLAEVVGGAVLAGELSLAAALAAGHLARAHERLGRGIRR